MATFQENLSHNLATFGWKVAPGDIPEFPVVAHQLRELYAWWNEAPDDIRAVVKHADLADALWQAGKLNEWPALHEMIKGNPFGTFTATMNDILTIVDRSHNQVNE